MAWLTSSSTLVGWRGGRCPVRAHRTNPRPLSDAGTSTAFNATESFEKHELIKFLESIGAEFGACQNAHTSFEETVGLPRFCHRRLPR